MMGTRSWSWLSVASSSSNCGKKAKSMVELSCTALSARLVLKCLTAVASSLDSALGRFDCCAAVLKARECTISLALRRETSWTLLAYFSIVDQLSLPTSCFEPEASICLRLHSARRLATSLGRLRTGRSLVRTGDA